MSTPQRFLFEGLERTAAEIRALVPCLSDAAVRGALRAGRNTRAAMLTFDAGAARRAGAARGRVAGERSGFVNTINPRAR